MKKIIFIVMQMILIFLLTSVYAEEVKRAMELTSPNFKNQGDIPKRYTCDGKDISPTLSWSAIPKGTESFVLIVDDPDAPDPKKPKMTWVHWILYNIPTSSNSLPEGVKSKDLPDATLEGLNDWKKTGYGGPCPPIGKHRYFHKLYALDIVLPNLQEPTKSELERAMEGHILEKIELIGLYQRN